MNQFIKIYKVGEGKVETEKRRLGCLYRSWLRRWICC